LGNKIIVLSHIFKSFDTKVIVSDFSHDFRQGERIGILGKNGV
jgi:ATP-binding cassette subfamily F protein uup